jgi:predicted DNA-binding WGR domain protein
MLAQVDKDFPERDRGFTPGSIAMKAKAAKPAVDFESFREKMLMLSLQDAPEPAPETPAYCGPPKAEIMKSIKLYYTDKSINSDKVYTLDIVKEPKYKDAYYVNFSYGKRNKTLRDGTKTKIAVTYKEADNIFRSVITEKETEGYTTNITGRPYAGVVRP